MSDAYPFLILEQPCNEAAAWVIRQVSGAGLQVLRTFDLQDARHDPAECPCPHHGTDRCDCQMVVLLIYGGDYQPVSLVAHSHDGKTWFSLVDTPQQRADPRMQRAILQALPSESIPQAGQRCGSHAS
jgi:hypothetical protein